jgi:phosphoribosylformylglycinamidine synthase
MPQPSVLLIRTAGTNCDEETRFAFERAGAVVTPLHIRALCRNPAVMDPHAILAFPGGFSYGDDLGSGVVLAHEIRHRLLEPFQRFIAPGGLVLGICNGFQILLETGLLQGAPAGPGSGLPEGADPAASPAGSGTARNLTLTHNDCQHFVDRWVTLRVEESSSPFLKGYAGRVITLPVAHAEGKFVARDEATLSRLAEEGQVAFRYLPREEDGSYLRPPGGAAEPVFPGNPSGSQGHIAGIVDPTGRVLGLMPHPERHILPWQHPRWTREGLGLEGDGIFLFRNAVQHAQRIG